MCIPAMRNMQHEKTVNKNTNCESYKIKMILQHEVIQGLNLHKKH